MMPQRTQIYLEHHKDLKMSKTESGLRYILASGPYGNTKPAREGEIVTLDVKTMLLKTGEICHQTDSIPPLSDWRNFKRNDKNE